MLWPSGSAIRPNISSPFGPRTGGAFSIHYGADLTGYTTVSSCGAGLVTFAGWMNGSAGYTVAIDLGGGVTEVHMHLATIAVARGDRVPVGRALGRMGSTGNATGNCDHLEIRINGTSIDPIPYVTARLAGTASGGTTTPDTPEDSMFIAIVRNKDWYLVVGGKAALLGAASGARESGAPILNFVDDWAVKQLKRVVSGIA